MDCQHFYIDQFVDVPIYNDEYHRAFQQALKNNNIDYRFHEVEEELHRPYFGFYRFKAISSLLLLQLGADAITIILNQSKQ